MFGVYRGITQYRMEALENISRLVREGLQIPVNKIVNYPYLKELVLKINENCDNLKVIQDRYTCFELRDDNNMIIKYDSWLDEKEQFEFVIRSLCYALLLDDCKINKSQLRNSSLNPCVILDDNESEILSRMIMLPKKLYIEELVNFSTDGSVDVVAMQKKLKIKYEDIIERGRYLPIWDRG